VKPVEMIGVVVRGLRVGLTTALVAAAVSNGTLAQTVDHHQHQPAEHAEQTSPQEGNGPEIPASRQGSGTAWNPDESPMYANHWQTGNWEVMTHGSLFVQYLSDQGFRGQDQFGSINWIMAMAHRPLGRGRFGLRGMVSLEPSTIGGCGYPDLLASGERCEGEAIVDRQHPHDLLMELSADYTGPISDSLAFQIYGGLSGEPALGPVAYPHRVSATPNPIAPISHHWMDATHISFGVVTAGVYTKRWKAEASLFNGREPDEHRYDLDLDALDSYSGRFWFLPNEKLAFQVSAGHLAEAEEADIGSPRIDVDRLTASAEYHRRFRNGGSIWASTLAWGRATESGESTNFILAETNVTFQEQDAWFGRLEVGGKKAHDLDIHQSTDVFTIGKLQAGYVRYFGAWNSVKPGVGVTATMGLVPSDLEDAYGHRANFGLGIYFTIRPSEMQMGSGHHMP
jgi:hypothetical protein